MSNIHDISDFENKNIIENLEDYIFEILKGNCTPDQWDAICAINPEMVSLESRHVLKIIQIIEARSLKEEGRTLSEIASAMNLDRVDVRPMKEAANE